MGKTSIEWVDFTMNFWLGCQKVSPACDHCYAESWAKRAGRGHLWEGQRERTKDWSGPKRWNEQARKAGVNARVFTNSLADFFDNQVPDLWRRDAWDVIGETPHLTWLILTKRPQNIIKMIPPSFGSDNYPNVWLGITAENQDEYWKRRSHLFAIQAARHFISYEPALGPLSIQGPVIPDLVICGGEDYVREGREFNLQWARDLRDECDSLDVSFFMKQVAKNVPIPADLMVRQFPPEA